MAPPPLISGTPLRSSSVFSVTEEAHRPEKQGRSTPGSLGLHLYVETLGQQGSMVALTCLTSSVTCDKSVTFSVSQISHLEQY